MRPFRFFVTLLACAACGTAVVRGGGLEARVAFHNGRPAIWVNGQPLPPLMYSGTEHSRDTWQGRPHQSLTEFGSLGYRIIQTDFWLKYSLREDGTFDWPGVRKQLDGILDAVSNAMIVARINVSAPPWWLHNHPGEICRVTFTNAADAVFSGNRAESLASDVPSARARSRRSDLCGRHRRTRHRVGRRRNYRDLFGFGRTENHQADGGQAVRDGSAALHHALF